MAYNRHFIAKRKNLKVFQTNSSAKITNKQDFEEFERESQILPGAAIIEDARRTGILKLSEFGFKIIPDEIYFINRPDSAGRQEISYDETYDSVTQWWDDELLYKLVLSRNSITYLSDKISNLSNLKYLDLEDNQISVIPPELTKLVNLEHLNLSKNLLVNLPRNLRMLTNLKELFLASNNIIDLPLEFCLMISMQKLDLCENALANLPDNFGNLVLLTHLDLSSNRLGKLPDSIVKLKELRYLDISVNRLCNLPTDWDANFDVLKLSVNMLVNFPINKYMPTLQELQLSNNAITTVNADHLAHIPNIRILNLSKNSINDLSNDIINLQTLTFLDISFNSINSIPYGLGSMVTLQTLIVEGNPFRSINRSILLAGTERLKQFLRNRSNEEDPSLVIQPLISQPQPALSNQLKETILSGSTIELSDVMTNASNNIEEHHHKKKHTGEAHDISEFNNSHADSLIKSPLTPPILNTIKNTALNVDSHELNSIGTINLMKRDINIIPIDFFQSLQHKRVMSLNVASNNITIFPIGITLFANSLHRLDISNNKLMELPDCFGCFRLLSYMNISYNSIRQLPPSMKCLGSCLEQLDISHNPLGIEIPEVIFSLSQLYILHASNCAIVHINAEGLAHMSHLTHLDLSSNDIEHIPLNLGLCQQIKHLNLDFNKIRHPILTAMLDYGTVVLMNYLKHRIDPLTQQETSNAIAPPNNINSAVQSNDNETTIPPSSAPIRPTSISALSPHHAPYNCYTDNNKTHLQASAVVK